MSWLKFDTSTPEKPEVLAITIAMGWDDPDLAVGKLLKVWRWFDEHTVEGNAARVTLALLDRLVGVAGFCQAMRDVGWLEVSDAGLRLPNFERHNGKTTKDRALTAKRVANHKSNAQGNAASVSEPLVGALPREEKRREETSPAGDVANSPGAGRGKAGYPAEFESAWQAYPERPGDSKANAHRAWAARRKEGVAAEVLRDGARRYAAFCRASATDPQYVKQAATFFGPGEHYLADWAPVARAVPAAHPSRRDVRDGWLAGIGPAAAPQPGDFDADRDERTVDAEAHFVG
ncbi:MAG: hypothetical protein J7556_22140 [Acidovorax sp.]|nr:hypothetical protein [Acidovorax sp.]